MKLPKKWFRKSNQTWYVEIAGKQYKLGKTEAEANEAYIKLMHQGASQDQQPAITAHKLIEVFWLNYRATHAKTSVDCNKRYKETFRESLPPMMLAIDVRPYHVHEWLDTTGSTTNNSRGTRIAFIRSMFEWGYVNGYIPANPVARIKKPTPEIREEFLPHSLWRPLIDAAYHKEVKQFIRFMLETGCRAEEMFKMQCEWYDKERKVIQFPAKATKGASSRKTSPRVIYLSVVATRIVERCVKHNHTGHIFRNTRGGAWNSNSIKRALKVAMRRLNKEREANGQAPIGQLCATMFRHSFAHFQIAKGQSIEIVAKLMGHKSTRQLYERYGHLDKGDILRDAIRGFNPLNTPKKKKEDDDEDNAAGAAVPA